MQRTVHGTNVNYAVLERDTNGQLTITEKVYKSTEKDTTKALKDFRKHHPTEAVISTEEFTALYVLDDEIFFKYATIATPDTDTDTDTDETPEK